MWSVIRKGFRRHALMVAFAGAALVAGLGVIAPESAQAATLYISEFASPVGQVGSVQANVYPQPAITDQTVAITGASVQSAAFNASTHAIQVECDSDCSISIGTNPTATTTNFLMGDGTPYQFVVVPGQKIAVISNTSGGSGSDVNIVAVGGNAVTTSVPVSLVGGSAGTSSTYGAAFPATGTAAGFTDGTNMQPAKVDSSGNQLVVGNVASGAADSGNPVKMGAVFNNALPTVSTGNRNDLQLNVNGMLQVSPVGGTSTADGQNARLTIDHSGNAVYLGVAGGLSNGTTTDRARSGGVTGMAGVNPQATPSGGASFNHISTATTTTVKSGSGTLYAVCVNTLGTVASTATIYDSTTGSGTVVGIINSLSVSGCFDYGGSTGIAFATGLTLVTTGTVAPDITVSYK